MSRRKIDVVGGGVAGLCLGIFLARRGVPVVVYEAQGYPRHRVCGEFLSPRDPLFLRKTGLEDVVASCADGRAESVLWEWPGFAAAKFSLEYPAWRVSRYRLDAALAEACEREGGRVVCGERVDVDSSRGRDGVVLAAGRRRSEECKWIGVKMHLAGVVPRADLEMLCGRGAYVGISAVGRDAVNVSGLFRARRVPGGKERGWSELLGQHGLGSHAERLDASMSVEGSFCAVSHLDFSLPARSEKNFCAVGDSFGMIAPLTGNGMSMAIESAWLAAGPLVDFSECRLDWSAACGVIAEKQRRAFFRRMMLARWSQRLLCADWLRPPLSAAAKNGWLPWRRLHAALG